jgi:PPM family protein phosphatase
MVTRPRTLRAAGLSDVGLQRHGNEDRFYVDPDRGVFIVVDGVGGHVEGGRAADTAITALRERLSRETGPVPDRIREAITIANNEVHRLASSRPDWRGMACVLTVAVVDGERAVIGHVGDSRLYKLEGTRIEKVTPDHSPIGEREDANELSEVEAMRHPRRNEVYRDVGSEPHTVSDPDFVFVADIELPADSALLLCSDGLTDQVDSQTISQIVSSHAHSPGDVVRALVDAANRAGGKDNVTAVFVQGEAFAPEPARVAWQRPTMLVLATVAGLAMGLIVRPDVWLSGAQVASPPGSVVVRATDTIMAAIERAAAGTEVIVEPGEYRERLTLKDHVRVVSRVPRGAVLRLPSGAGERDAAIVAAGLTNAELSGFRIVGDAATPLGVGVITRDAAVRLIDIEISGAATAALDLGAGGEAVLLASDIHDNPGAALFIRAGSTTRLAHNVFAKNATSERTAAAFVVERDTRLQWSRNVFHGMGPEAFVGLDEARRALLPRDNLFIADRPAVPAAPAGTRNGRGR